MIAEARLARARAMRCVGEQRSECVLDQLRLNRQIVRREHEAGLLYRSCWLSEDPRRRALCGVIDQELERRFDNDGPVILRNCVVHQKKPHSTSGLERLRRCLLHAATVIETLCGELKIAAE